MRHAPIRIRTFILGTVLLLLTLPTLAGAAAWLIDRNLQHAEIDGRLNRAAAYVTAHHDRRSMHRFASLVTRLDLLAQVVVMGSQTKSVLYVSPTLDGSAQKKRAAALLANSRQAGGAASVPLEVGGASWVADRRSIPIPGAKPPATLAVDLYYRPASRSARALVGLVTGIVVLIAGLGVAIWLAGRWMVAPLGRLSAQVDKVAGGDLTIAVPRSRIDEIANIAQAVNGMTAALGDSAQRRAEADEARRFLVSSVAHDLRTPLFALRGHLQAIGSRLGDPQLHLQRAEARADALERLVSNLFAYTRDDYAQPSLQLEAVCVDDALHETIADLEHTADLGDNTFDLDGDGALAVIADRDRLRRALTNVLDNALRYSPPGAAVHVRWAASGATSVEMTVADHGSGIDPDLLPHIFEPGIRGAPAPGGADDGAGLGLAIAKRLLEHQHASITVENQATDGAVVRLTLARAPSDQPAGGSVGWPVG